ncbi:MAG TPA: NAD(P)H-dependent oxidoreductase [Thermoleophilaceae bacterium]
MNEVKVLFISGSTRRRSAYTAAAHTGREILGPHSAAVFDSLAELPEFRGNGRLPSAVASLDGAIATADAVVFCTPQYVGRLPESLLNLLDWVRLSGALHGKRATWINSGPDWTDDAAVSCALRRAGAKILSPRGHRVPVAVDAVDAHGLIADPDTLRRLATALRAILQELATGATARASSAPATPLVS